MKYTIGGRVFVQKELTWKKDAQLIELTQNLFDKISSDEQLTIQVYIKLLFTGKVMGDFLAIVLDEQKPGLIDRVKLRFNKTDFDPRQDPGKLPNSVIHKIFNDFFFLNKAVLKKLITYGDVLTTLIPTIKEMEPLKNSALTSKRKTSRKSKKAETVQSGN